MYRNVRVSGCIGTKIGVRLASYQETSGPFPITSVTIQSYFSSEKCQPDAQTLHLVESLIKCTYSLEFSPSTTLFSPPM